MNPCHLASEKKTGFWFLAAPYCQLLVVRGGGGGGGGGFIDKQRMNVGR